MPKDGMEIYLTPLEVAIMRGFFNAIYLTNKEMADVLRVLANKLDRQGKAIEKRLKNG